MENNKSNFVGNIGEKIETVALFSRCFTIERRGFPSWKTVLIDVCEFVDESGNVYVWFTSAIFKSRRGDTVKLRGTIKAHDEYKGTKQTVLTRCKVETISSPIDRAKKQKEEQVINGDILIMPYRQYKNHYSDCATVKNSYNEHEHTIGVIIPDGRMKKNGVRGQHFTGYEFSYTENNVRFISTYRAIDEEHAIAHLKREHKTADNIKIEHVYFY